MNIYIHTYMCHGSLMITHCGDEENGRIGLSLRLHYVCITVPALCLLSTLCVMNQFLFCKQQYIYLK